MAIHQSSEQQRKTMTMKETTLEQTEMSSIIKKEKDMGHVKDMSVEEIQEATDRKMQRDHDVRFALQWHKEKGMEITPEFKKSVWDLYSAKNNLPQPWGEVNV